jgi:hypothetical protein
MDAAAGPHKLHGMAIMRSPPEASESNMCAKVCFIEGAGDGFR